jgi:Ca2+-transporting ATPase
MAELTVVCSGIAWGLTDTDGKHLFMLLPIHLLWLDLVTEILMTTALINDPLRADSMDRKPDEFTQDLLPIRAAVFPSCMGGIVALAVLSISIINNHSYALVFTAMVIFELIALNVVRLYYDIGLTQNKSVLVSCTIIIALQLLLIYIPPLATVFHLQPLVWFDWLLICSAGCGVFISGYILVHCMKRKGAG